MSGEGKAEAYTYMLRCSDGTLYTGWTYDLKRRVEVHNSGKGAKYTRSRLPVELVYAEVFSAKEAAMSREFAIKRLTRKQKLQLIQSRKIKADGSCTVADWNRR